MSVHETVATRPMNLSVFLLRCKLTVGRFEKRIDPDFPRELDDGTVLVKQ
jgi:hypothetical protein